MGMEIDIGIDKKDRKAIADGLSHPIVQFHFTSPAVERRRGVRVVGRAGDQPFVRPDGAVHVTQAVQRLAEDLARLRRRGIDGERALQRVFRIGVAPLQKRGDACAKQQLRVSGVGDERLAKRLRRGAGLSGGQRVPPGLLKKRCSRIDLRVGGRREQHERESRCASAQSTSSHSK